MVRNTYRILAMDHLMNNNTWETGLNNNDLIIGPSGAGKTRNYVKPNLMQCNESIIVADTKGSLRKEIGPLLKKNGYQILNIDFTDTLQSYGYNPLDYVRYDRRRKKYMEQDILKLVECLVPIETNTDPYWDYAARMYLESMIGYTLECFPEEEHNLKSVYEVFAQLGKNTDTLTGLSNFDRLFMELGELNPDSFAYRRYTLMRNNSKAEKMHASIIGILAEKLDTLIFDGAVEMYQKQERIRFKDLGQKKTVVFLTISDTDRSLDRLVNLFYTQALQALCDSADKDYTDNRLKVPVRIILDDFATNAYIPEFDKIISVIRSREIYVSVILQSISQLSALYGENKAMTIINNCDNCLYLGGQDVETARFIGIKADKPASTILNLPLNSVYLFTRGRGAKLVEKYDIKKHPRYSQLPEAMKEVIPRITKEAAFPGEKREFSI